jgi:hypothetical protein
MYSYREAFIRTSWVSLPFSASMPRPAAVSSCLTWCVASSALRRGSRPHIGQPGCLTFLMAPNHELGWTILHVANAITRLNRGCNTLLHRPPSYTTPYGDPGLSWAVSNLPCFVDNAYCSEGDREKETMSLVVTIPRQTRAF